MGRLFAIVGLLALAGCYQVYETPDGRQFKLTHTCIEGHYHPYTGLQHIGKSTFPVTRMVWTCDQYQVDTVWINDMPPLTK